MRLMFPLATALVLTACAGTTASQEEYPEDKVTFTGSHIPLKDRSTGKPISSGDADAMIRSQKVLGSPAGVPGSAGRSN
jgi:hypothetical protein